MTEARRLNGIGRDDTVRRDIIAGALAAELDAASRVTADASIPAQTETSRRNMSGFKNNRFDL